MPLETLAVLLFTVFAVPGACLIVCIVGAVRGYRTQRQYKRKYASWPR